MITKLGMLAATSAAALTTAYSAPAHAWGWHRGYARPAIAIGIGAPILPAAPVVAPYPYGYAGYGYGVAPVYGYGAYGGWHRPYYGGYGRGVGYGYGHGGYGHWGRGWGGGHRR